MIKFVSQIVLAAIAKRYGLVWVAQHRGFVYVLCYIERFKFELELYTRECRKKSTNIVYPVVTLIKRQ